MGLKPLDHNGDGWDSARQFLPPFALLLPKGVMVNPALLYALWSKVFRVVAPGAEEAQVIFGSPCRWVGGSWKRSRMGRKGEKLERPAGWLGELPGHTRPAGSSMSRAAFAYPPFRVGFNSVGVLFLWSAPPFPSIVKAVAARSPGFPGIAATDFFPGRSSGSEAQFQLQWGGETGSVSPPPPPA